MEAHKINLRVGETHELELGGLGSAGYVWEHQIDGLADVASVSKKPVAPPPPPPIGTIPKTTSVSEIFIIKALRSGETKIRFRLRRPWERDGPPLKDLILEISVSE